MFKVINSKQVNATAIVLWSLILQILIIVKYDWSDANCDHIVVVETSKTMMARPLSRSQIVSETLITCITLWIIKLTSKVWMYSLIQKNLMIILNVMIQVSLSAKQLIYRLLQRDPTSRLGSNGGANDIKNHPFFRGINWALVRCTVT